MSGVEQWLRLLRRRCTLYQLITDDSRLITTFYSDEDQRRLHTLTVQTGTLSNHNIPGYNCLMAVIVDCIKTE